MPLLILNAGSSSLRAQWIETKAWSTLFKAHVDGIGLNSCRFRGIEEKKVRVRNHAEALELILNELKISGQMNEKNPIEGIGHRVVHGGERYTQPTLITPKILRDLEKISPLAPLHNPANLEGIRACLKHLPNVPNIAVFDTAFHATLPEHAYLYGLPWKLYQRYGIRRYGFHGTSHRYVAKNAIEWLKKNNRPHGRLVTCHLGNGVSLTAVKNGKSIDTSMGFTPLEGVPMGTRSGSFDPAIILHLLKQGISAEQIENWIEHEAGLKGLSEVSSDVRPLRDIHFSPKHPRHNAVERAFEVYAYQIAKTIGSYTVALGGLDGLVFTAGIGENAWYLREKILTALTCLGVKVSSKQNRARTEGKTGPIHLKTSSVAVLVLATNEELQIAHEVKKNLPSSRKAR